MKIGDKVIAPDGLGEIIDTEEIFKKLRHGVKMDNETQATCLYKNGIKYYWQTELKGVC